MSERHREELARPWRVRKLEDLARVSRPLRRRLTPSHFKETYVNQALGNFDPPTVYLEIGVREGESFRIAQADVKIGIDPERMSTMESLKPGERYFEATSDDFFDRHAPAVLEPGSVHVALVDGLHEFRQVLRDLMNLEPYMRRDGVVIIDDCNPPNAERGSDTPVGGAWNGDVWKLPVFLIEERPDLRVTTIDADEGVGVVTGFGAPARPVDDAVVERYKSLPYDYLAANRAKVLHLRPRSRIDPLLP